MATSGLETINGNTYFVVRDDAGTILRQEGRSAATSQPPAVISKGDIAAGIALLTKPPAQATVADIFAILQFILKKQITG